MLMKWILVQNLLIIWKALNIVNVNTYAKDVKFIGVTLSII